MTQNKPTYPASFNFTARATHYAELTYRGTVNWILLGCQAPTHATFRRPLCVFLGSFLQCQRLVTPELKHFAKSKRINAKDRHIFYERYQKEGSKGLFSSRNQTVIPSGSSYTE
jgi:hypothetical protein